MALIKCPECGREISDTCEYCIHCGFKLKTPAKVEEKEEKSGIEIIAFRGSAGVLILLSIICIVFGLTASTFMSTIILRRWYNSVSIVFYVIILLIGLFYIGVGIYGFINIGRNASVKKPCIEFDNDRKKVIVYNLSGEKIEFKPSEFVSLKAHMLATDGYYVIRFSTSNGVVRKVKLGVRTDSDSANHANSILLDLREKYKD